MNTVVVVGSLNLDLVVVVSRVPAVGETVAGSDVFRHPGGKGANQAVAAHRLGARTVLVGAIGDDPFGTDLRTALTGEGLPLDQVTTVEGAASGTAMIVVGNDGDNMIVVSPGANGLLDGAALAGLDAVLAPQSVLVLQLEVPLATCIEAARLARRLGATVLLNASPLPKLDDPAFADLLRIVDVLVVNETETLRLTARDDRPADADGWAGLAAALHAAGPVTVVVTLGADGAASSSPEGIGIHDAFPVEVVDTTGAGDTLCGALAAGLAEGLPLAEAVRRGCAAGAIACTAVGAQSAMPTLRDLSDFMTWPTTGSRTGRTED